MTQQADVTTARPPHPPLTGWYGGAGQRDGFVQDLFDRAAPAYDRINAGLSLGSGAWYRRRMLLRAGLAPGQRLLDLAVGTGLTAREAVGITGDPRAVLGLDLSEGMLRQARRTLPIPLLRARAEALPLADASFDMLSMGYALRHVPDLGAAFAEFRRVLRPGGRLLLLEIARPRSRLGLAALRLYMGRLVPAASRGLGPAAAEMMSYYWDTIDACVPPEAIEAALATAGFARIRCEVQFGILRATIAEAP